MPKGRNLCLIGFMATGKTTVAQLLARALGWHLRDTDREIESITGLSIPAIFAYYGENYFRFLETAVLVRFVEGERQVIATGGGIVLSAVNRELLKEAGPVVWLKADLETILARTQGTHDRPLLETPARKERVEKLLAERQELYRSLADFQVDTSQLSPQQVAERILAWLENSRELREGRVGKLAPNA
ncbi:MAG: shikimate kinase [Bacillota bacterium]|jgi:shikimate kinase|nr:shikimate kinase [Bacillota bacterium]